MALLSGCSYGQHLPSSGDLATCPAPLRQCMWSLSGGVVLMQLRAAPAVVGGPGHGAAAAAAAGQPHAPRPGPVPQRPVARGAAHLSHCEHLEHAAAVMLPWLCQLVAVLHDSNP